MLNQGQQKKEVPMNVYSLIERVQALWGVPASQIIRTSRRRNGCFRPRLECLEDRQLPSTLFLTPGGHDATHFSMFQDAYNAASQGDVIEVEPGAVVSDPSGTI